MAESNNTFCSFLASPVRCI